MLKDNERIDDLQLRGYKLIQKTDGFCFGMDAVLIANYVKTKKNDIIVDLGTGTGIIPLIINAKNDLKKIYAIEIQENIAEMANRTIKLNNLEDKINIINIDLKNSLEYLGKNKIDIVVSNPPYMSIGEGLVNEIDTKKISRHEIKCNIEDICKIAGSLLKHNGKFFMVHRPSRLADIIINLRKYKLEPKEMQFVYPKIGKEANLVLIKAIKAANPELRLLKPLIVYTDGGEYTEEIRTIYGLEEY